jgi:hypothetical protein
MKKKIAMLVFLAFATVSLAQPANTTEIIETQISETTLEILTSWQSLAIFALIISAILVGLAYMFSISFEMPELQAWAGNEVSQVIANAILILALVVVIGFLDTTTSVMINASEVSYCEVGQNCLQNTSLLYLTDYIGGAEDGAKDCLKNTMQAGAWVGRSIGIYANTIWLLQLGVRTTLAANYILDVDRYTLIYEYYMGILSSLYSQKFFLEQFAFKAGPVLLALGVVARTFFITRKTGGLLIAIAAGVMFFLPMMYVFDWVTLDMVVKGDNAIEKDMILCPSECRLTQPLAYYGDTKLYDQSNITDMFEDKDAAVNLSRGKIASLDNGTVTVYSCNYDEDPDDGIGCPPACRELPYPASLPECADLDNQTACAELSDNCKVIRLVDISDPEHKAEYEMCPEVCRVVPPLRGDCDIDDCLESRLDCRVAKRSDLEWRPSVDEHAPDPERCHDYAQDCPASLDAYESCTWVLPDSGPCDTLCGGCPAHCRIAGADLSNLPEDCFEEDSDELLTACEECHPTCMLERDAIKAKDPPSPLCSNCPPERRLMGGSMPPEYYSGDCSLEECPTDYRLSIPRAACEQCLEVSESYIYDPPINVNCGDMCKPNDNIPVQSPSDYMKSGSEDMVGFSEIQNVSKYMIPAYLLPLFNIAATLIFIRTFSGMIGGDIDIPGISKVF